MSIERKELKPYSASKTSTLAVIPAITGVWQNELGSTMTITSFDGENFSGTYTSAVSEGQGPVTGTLAGTLAGDAVAFTVSEDRRIGFEQLPVTKDEPLKLELEAFLDSVATRKPPQCSGAEGLGALELALAILAKIEEHTKLIARQLQPRT